MYEAVALAAGTGELISPEDTEPILPEASRCLQPKPEDEYNQRKHALRWYVAETLPRSEQLAQHHLERQHFKCFCPRFRATRRHARKMRTVLAPLFPGYIFVQFSVAHDRWQSINGTLGIKRLVGLAGGKPQAMPTEAISAIFARCDRGEARHVLPDIQPGQTVRLTAGPFADTLAEIESLDSRGRVRILLDILGGCKSVEVHIRDVGPV